MLLKVTHIPIVATIWLWEAAHAQVIGGASKFSSIGPGPTRLRIDSTTGIARKQRPFLSNRTNTKASSRQFPETPQEDGSHSPGPQDSTIRTREESDGKTVIVDNTNLEQRVADLSAQIAEVMALLIAQQGTADDD
jgi:hypothetical protein